LRLIIFGAAVLQYRWGEEGDWSDNQTVTQGRWSQVAGSVKTNTLQLKLDADYTEKTHWMIYTIEAPSVDAADCSKGGQYSLYLTGADIHLRNLVNGVEVAGAEVQDK
jgi:hypothetical protein